MLRLIFFSGLTPAGNYNPSLEHVEVEGFFRERERFEEEDSIGCWINVRKHYTVRI
jgi:hypothetical protein